jgi:hypothetical protein
LFSQFFFLAALIVALQGYCLLVPFDVNPVLIRPLNWLLSGVATSLAFSVRPRGGFGYSLPIYVVS